MNTITKYYKVKSLKLVMIVGLLCICLTTTIQAQKSTTSTTTAKTQGDKDWDILISAMNYERNFEKRSQLAEAFWNNYPEHPMRFKALWYFMGPFAKPNFISNNMPDKEKQLLDSLRLRSKDFKRYTRSLTVDAVAMKQWRKKGDIMIKSVLSSDVSLERKEGTEFQLITREFYAALSLDHPLDPFKKEKEEVDYWNRFEVQYWQNIRFLLENHVNKYAELDIVASRVQNILNVLAPYSKAAKEAYWNYFSETTGADNPHADQPGIKALHKLASENVAAIESLKVTDFTKPLEMAFTAMDGTKVDLANMRGKVVLIDFWATYCGPCIKEMPHVQEMYDKYKDQGFEVVGIAADNDSAKERIEGILKKTGAQWPQRLDQGPDVSVSFHALYRITSLPTVWLLNKEGVIVDRKARGARLEPLIRKHLGLTENSTEH